MPRYRVHRIKSGPREHFRWAAHSGGLALIKIKDYQQAEEIEASSPYAAWKQMAQKECPLLPGDVLETIQPEIVAGTLQLFKYIGFEPAQWLTSEIRQTAENSPEPFSRALEA